MARIVVAGSGAVGASVAYHLALLGADDVVVAERDELVSGSTSRAMGGVRQQFSTAEEVILARESIDFLARLGPSLFRQVGYLFLATTEEGLAAVPKSIREGSMALGATKFETIWRVVLPAAAPGVLTGMILAMARAAGEVAPLMIVGMVKLAPTLPIDHHFPFVHLERKFMHLGFHVYDVGFQSANSEAAKPMVFTTTLLLIAIVAGLNLAAVWVRGRLRRKFTGNQF